MAEHFSFFDAVQLEDGTYEEEYEYDAQKFTNYFKILVTTGVMKSAGNMLVVSTNGSNMITKVNTGIAFIEGRYYENDSFKELTHDTETLGNSRIDRIVVRMDLSTEARYVKSFIKKGVPSTNPVAPALTQTANYYEISLAQVKIVGGQTFIATNAITDERGTNVICPWAGSNILPSYDDNALAKHLDDYELHAPYTLADSTDGRIYTVNIEGVTDYVEGMSIAIKIAKTNTQVSYLNVNSLGAKNIIKAYGNGVLKGELVENMIYTLRYNGNHFVIQGDGIALNNTLTSTSTTEAATANAVKTVNDLKANKKQMTSLTLSGQNGWNFAGVRYYKDEIGEVHVYGHATAGTKAKGTVIATLPSGYRPNSLPQFAVMEGDTTDTVYHPNMVMVNSFNGEIQLLKAMQSSTAVLYFSFSFKTTE